jgi:DNA-directed RNA polymerase specialized sigma24 family protein
MPSAYYATPAAPNRKRNPITRSEYQSRRTEFAPRGLALPQTKLLPLQIVTIRSADRQRKALLTHIRENLSNAALAKQFGVHESTIEKVLSRETGSHIA